MSTQEAQHFPHEAGPALPMSEPRPFYWSIRRELWENRSVWMAPIIVAAVVLFATAISVIVSLVRMIRGVNGGRGPAGALHAIDMAPAPIMLTTLLVAFFYCLDALYGERRDRSILFWKSLPVSDRTTLLSKAAIPFLVLPFIAIVLSVLAQTALRFLGTFVLLASGESPLSFWAGFDFFSGLVIMVYGLGVHVLWFAPIYGWLLLVSAWARRAPFLWALLPLLAVAAVERIVFNSMVFMSMLQYRMTGAMKEAFAGVSAEAGNVNRLSELDPVTYFTRPGFWLGLMFFAACLSAAARLRRKREPI